MSKNVFYRMAKSFERENAKEFVKISAGLDAEPVFSRNKLKKTIETEIWR